MDLVSFLPSINSMVGGRVENKEVIPTFTQLCGTDCRLNHMVGP